MQNSSRLNLAIAWVGILAGVTGVLCVFFFGTVGAIVLWIAAAVAIGAGVWLLTTHREDRRTGMKIVAITAVALGALTLLGQTILLIVVANIPR